MITIFELLTAAPLTSMGVHVDGPETFSTSPCDIIQLVLIPPPSQHISILPTIHTMYMYCDAFFCTPYKVKVL